LEGCRKSARRYNPGALSLQITTGDAGKGKLPLNVIQNWTAELGKK
jgi:hypothetical protein